MRSLVRPRYLAPFALLALAACGGRIASSDDSPAAAGNGGTSSSTSNSTTANAADNYGSLTATVPVPPGLGLTRLSYSVTDSATGAYAASDSAMLSGSTATLLIGLLAGSYTIHVTVTDDSNTVTCTATAPVAISPMGHMTQLALTLDCPTVIADAGPPQGEVALRATIPNPFDVSVVYVSITGPAAYSTVVQDGATGRVYGFQVVATLPAGTGYMGTVSGITTDGKVRCVGSTGLSVAAGTTTAVDVQVQCTLVDAG